MEFRKIAMTTLYARLEKDTDVYNGLLDSEGEGEGGMIWENGIETMYNIIYETNSQSRLMHDTGCLGLVH